MGTYTDKSWSGTKQELRETLVERWNINPGCWVEIHFYGLPSWRGIRVMVRRLLLLLPEVGSRIYQKP
jgi:hypothetical protein